MPKLGLLTIGTNKYLDHAIACQQSFLEWWDGSSELCPILFTNKQLEPNTDIYTKLCHIPHLPWPLVTLFRYHSFLEYRDILEKYDYLIFINANARANSPLGQEFLSDVVAVEHPGFYGKPPKYFPYEINPSSSANIRLDYHYLFCPHYCQGFLQGGKTEIFLQICKKLCQNINDDLYNNIIAIWHDESHWNKILQCYPPTQLLHPGYAYPESWTLPFEKKIISLDKNHKEIREINGGQ